ncbi:MAG: restriction endonuclease subunit S [Anaerolineae bacterium]|nr:restriction endonuclease subunit S [Anaerolineae bacterium]
MEGLEVSEASFSKLISVTETMRFDADYFHKAYLRDEKSVQSQAKSFQKFSDFDLAVDGSAFYPAIEEFYDSGNLPFLRVADVDSVIDFERCTTIPDELCTRFETLKKVQTGDIVLTKGGSVARIGLVTRRCGREPRFDLHKLIKTF